jgi:hypothetical protein
VLLLHQGAAMVACLQNIPPPAIILLENDPISLGTILSFSMNIAEEEDFFFSAIFLPGIPRYARLKQLDMRGAQNSINIYEVPYFHFLPATIIMLYNGYIVLFHVTKRAELCSLNKQERP